MTYIVYVGHSESKLSCLALQIMSELGHHTSPLDSTSLSEDVAGVATALVEGGMSFPKRYLLPLPNNFAKREGYALRHHVTIPPWALYARRIVALRPAADECIHRGEELAQFKEALLRMHELHLSEITPKASRKREPWKSGRSARLKRERGEFLL
jgi:hypothetical protein